MLRCFLISVAIVLGGCAQALPTGVAEHAGAPSAISTRPWASTTPPLRELYNLDYSNGTITVFRVTSAGVKVYRKFRPSHGRAQGIAVDPDGNIYTTASDSKGDPCFACVQVFTARGQRIAQWDAPILPGAPDPPDLTDISVDVHANVYVSDYGQQAVYMFPSRNAGGRAPIVIAKNSQDAASVLSSPHGHTVFVSGGCGFAAVRPYTAVGVGHYEPGACFGIGTIALIGGAADDRLDVLTPVDGAPGVVSVSSPAGGKLFRTPDQRYASISGVAMPANGSVAYVADHHNESVYAFARPAQGWLNPGRPRLLATYSGFKNLDIIAVRP